jgi:hypothetical protein
MKHSCRLVLACASLVAVLAPALGNPLSAGASKSKSQGTRVSIRVEGMHSTLLPETVLLAKAQSIDPDGKPADTCEGDTAAAALQQATKGHWKAGAYYSGLGYSVEGLFGESYSFSSDYYWSFWIDGKVASAGICGATLHAGEQLLFFPQCSKESAEQCPEGLFDPPVLQVNGPKRARVGNTIVVRVTSLDNLTGKPSPAAEVKLRLGKQTVTTNAAGKARVRLTKVGKAHILASAPGAIRDELAVSVRR